jgi:glycosyltransferase involved in cell wall biosynthesis
MSYEIWVAGYPSFLGGADSELLHNIDLWRSYDVEVNLVPMFGCDARIKSMMTAMGVRTHDYRPNIFRDKILASWCNGEFLGKLPEIMQKGRPRAVVWFNCMTWTFPRELAAHQNGWINHHGFVSSYQRNWLKPQLALHGKVNELEGYRPYFNPKNAAQDIQFQYRPPQKWFALGRISRDDGFKYSDDMWNIFYKVCTPGHKKVFILGYGPNAQAKCGNAPAGLDWQTWNQNEVPVKQVYQILHCLIHKTGGSRESYCRIVPEAYGYGVPVIVEDDYAFPDLVQDGVTGFRCKSSDEMSYRASQLAFDEPLRKKIVHEAYDYLTNDIASREKCWQPWEQLFKNYAVSNQAFAAALAAK